MSVTVRIPTILRTYTDGSLRGDAPRAALSPRCWTTSTRAYPGIQGRVVDDAGELRRFVNVYVGNDDVRFLDDLDHRHPRRHPDLGDPRRRRRLTGSTIRSYFEGFAVTSWGS